MPDPAQPQQPDLADELLRRMTTDQHARGVRDNGEIAAPDYELMRTVDNDNTAALQRIIDEHGWPGHSLVGEQAANAAWLIAQHADLDFQQRALGLVRDAVTRNDATTQQLALLTDRVLMRQGQPQIYGTQYRDLCDGRGYQLWDVTDPDNLDVRRAEADLGPHADYEVAIRSTYRPHPQELRAERAP
ncbi:hypothetical protein SSP35_01_08770 [Streptomyces sp. NBRC 110611]|uniref:DUF6624 domain-containing protein n=1 Tax=Streptomyces sp. NBRC 110611 TaxID=1621259 RepID=UPI000858940E|nr:DUF6624 domain-containing protein [Streptomyces sp. NBRC 110611]GAU65533.1 hypothetical protein SSP35_01_08770 [Streptomyces sp. NBRC 110611]